MNILNFSKRLMYMLSVFCCTVAVQAQDTSTGMMEEVIVRGIRGSLKASLQTKRNAIATVDSINAEDIGKFPAKNVGEALAHVPGVTVDRDFGDGEKISVRGTAPTLNRTLLNGQTVATADWFILDSPGRTFNYTLLPPEMVGSLDVYKTSEAWIDEGSVGATVIVNTRRPLDLPGFTATLSGEYGYHDRSEEGNPNFSGMLGWKNDADTYGIIVSAMRQEQDIRRDGLEAFSYPSAGGFPAGLNVDPNAIFPNALNSAHFEQNRTRTGTSIGLQAQPTDQINLEANLLYVKAEFDNFNQSRFGFIGNGNTLATATSATVNNGIVTAADFGTGSVTNLDSIVRDSEVELYSVHLKGGFEQDRWKLSAEGGKTRATGGTQQQFFVSFDGGPTAGGYSFDISGAPDRPAVVNFADDPTDPASLPTIGFAQLREQPTSDEETYFQGDLEYDLQDSLGLFTSVQAGVKYRTHTTTQDANLVGVTGDPSLAGLGLPAFFGGLTPSDFQDGQEFGGDLNRHALASESEIRSRLSAINTPLAPFPNLAFNVEEDITAAYGQINFEGERFRGNFGLRFVHTEQSSEGTIVAGGVPAPLVVDKTYNDWLPSVNLAFDITDDIIVRMAASRNLSRPDFNNLAAFTSLQETVLSGNGGNPNLDPFRSNNFDIGVEWYYEEGGLLSAAFFYKDLGSFIFNQTLQEQHFNILTNQVDTFDINRPANGQGGIIKGLELIGQKVFENGFGVSANYTFSNGDTEEGLEIPFNSEHAFSITPYFENELVSANITYSFRSEYFRAVGRNGVVTTNDDYASLDAALTYHVTDNIDLTFQGQNLLDETQYQFAGGTDSAPLNIYLNGRKFFFGARYNF